MPDAARAYIDYDAFAHYCEMSGDMAEFRFDGQAYTVTNSLVI